jgi:hypothetical protein
MIEPLKEERKMEDELAKKLGRTSLYKPEYCKEVIEMGKLGYSKEQMAAKLNVSWGSLDNWAKQSPEFLLALRTAIQEELSYWEQLGLNNVLETPGAQRLNGNVYNKIMAARFPAKYSERSKVELSGVDGAPIQLETHASLGTEILNDILLSLQDPKTIDMEKN